MPIYAYICADCGAEHDVLQKISDAPLTTCPSCNKESLIKQLTAPAFRLKGSGWYETDFKTDNKRNLAGNEQATKKEEASTTKQKEGKDKNKNAPSSKSETKSNSSTTASAPSTATRQTTKTATPS